jgi:hypothetical protein
MTGERRSLISPRTAAASALMAMVLVAGAAHAQTAPAQAAAPAAPPDPLKFTISSPVMIFNQIKPERAADFEAGWAAIRTQLLASARPELKAVGETLGQIFKVDTALAGLPPVQGLYIIAIEKPVQGVSYNPGSLIYETLWNGGKEGGIAREEADKIYEKFKDVFVSVNPMPLVKVGL